MNNKMISFLAIIFLVITLCCLYFHSSRDELNKKEREKMISRVKISENKKRNEEIEDEDAFVMPKPIEIDKSKAEEDEEIYDLLRKNRINDQFVIITFTNIAHYDFARNLIESYKRSKVKKFVFFCYDEEVCEKLENEQKVIAINIPSHWCTFEFSREGELVWRSEDYQNMLKNQFQILYRLSVDANITYLHVDTDVVFMSDQITNYLSFLLKTREFDLMMANENYKKESYGCFGFMLVKPSNTFKV